MPYSLSAEIDDSNNDYTSAAVEVLYIIYFITYQIGQ